MPHSIRIHRRDSVAVALRPLLAGEQVNFDGAAVTIAANIPQGHKFALRDHPLNTAVLKYGAQIGRTTQQIPAGSHVHSHNLATALAGELAYDPAQRTEASVAASAQPQPVWQGYRRSDGRFGTRNEVWILPTVGCVGMTAEQVARDAQNRHGGKIDGIHAFSHPHGCSQLGDDLNGTRAALAGLACNPNAAGVLLLGLGCESNQLDALIAAVPAEYRRKVRTLSSQAAGDELAAAAALVDELVEHAALARRERAPLSALTIGLKCGGSDGLSGLTANPLLGRLSDRLAAAGGTPILTEIPEIFGAEDNLLRRAATEATFLAASGLINRFKRYYIDQGLPVSENPSPGNLAGGITTLEEKSLGALQKAGSAALRAVADYGQQAPAGGLALLEAPGNDAVSSTALAAAGATLILFTTGRGTPLGFPVPTLKIASNRALAEAKPHWIDFDASRMLDEPAASIDSAFLDCVLAAASGQPCAAERSGQRAIAIWKRGVTL